MQHATRVVASLQCRTERLRTTTFCCSDGIFFVANCYVCYLYSPSRPTKDWRCNESTAFHIIGTMIVNHHEFYFFWYLLHTDFEYTVQAESCPPCFVDCLCNVNRLLAHGPTPSPQLRKQSHSNYHTWLVLPQINTIRNLTVTRTTPNHPPKSPTSEKPKTLTSSKNNTRLLNSTILTSVFFFIYFSQYNASTLVPSCPEKRRKQ
jgi:hypothetical protein